MTLIIRDSIPRNALMKIGLDKDIAATLVADLVSLGSVEVQCMPCCTAALTLCIESRYEVA